MPMRGRVVVFGKTGPIVREPPAKNQARLAKPRRFTLSFDFFFSPENLLSKHFPSAFCPLAATANCFEFNAEFKNEVVNKLI